MSNICLLCPTTIVLQPRWTDFDHMWHAGKYKLIRSSKYIYQKINVKYEINLNARTRI